MATEKELNAAVSAALQRALNLLPDYPEQANDELEQVLKLTAKIRELRQKEASDTGE